MKVLLFFMSTVAAVVSLVVYQASALEPYDTAAGQACIRAWEREAANRLNRIPNDRRPWGFDKYGNVTNVHYRTAWAPNDWRTQWRSNRYFRMWYYYNVNPPFWRDRTWNNAGVPSIRSYTQACLARVGPTPARPGPSPTPRPRPTPTQGGTRGGPRFEKPLVNGAMIDHCATWGKNCGRGGADLFCRSRGYASASSWNTTYGRTWVIGSRRFCIDNPQSNRCIGYTRIICQGAGAVPSGRAGGTEAPPGRSNSGGGNSGRTESGKPTLFDRPLINGAMPDWCATWGRNCGRGGADLFCRSRGFRSATTWSTGYGNTWVIGSNQFCKHSASNKCIGLVRVWCK